MHPRPAVPPTLLAAARTDAVAGARAGRLSEGVVEELRASGLSKLYLPAALGGAQTGLPDACDVIAEVSAADAAAGWALMIGAGPNWFAGVMAPALAEEVFARTDGCVAGSGTPGVALAVPGGYRVSGRWKWCSGAPWAPWFTLAVQGEGLGPSAVAVPAADVQRVPDSWRVRGLAATASEDVVLQDVFVPSARLFPLDGPSRRDEPIFRVPFRSFAETTMAAVAVGLARHLLEEFAALVRAKTPALATAPLAAQPLVQDRFARAGAVVRAAAAWWAAEVSRLWDAVLATPAGTPLDPTLMADVQLACVHACASAANAAELLRPLTGMTTLPDASPLGQLIADAHAVGHNTVVADARFTDAGAVLLS